MSGRPWPELAHTPRHDDPYLMASVRLRRVSRGRAQDLREDLAHLYTEARRVRVGETHCGLRRTLFLRRLAADIRRPGFVLVIAETDHLVGCAFGFPLPSDGRWWFGFDGTLPCDVARLTTSGDVFAISEILVRPHRAGGELACRLQERLLTGRRASLGAALVDPADLPALAGFRSGGWQDIGTAWNPTGPPPLRALILRFAERTFGRPTEPPRPSWTRKTA
ncbi:hypothetical protein ABZ734_30990 [Streptomyces sp. NPDC006660]|uniref:hypothetical protein n=1 Tax=Streptomyces sp. NPDC006660 TaxID=3156901 RepID=UPI0033E7E99E